MKGIQWELLSFLKNNVITNHTAIRVRLWNLCVEQDGSVSEPLHFGSSWTAVVGFCEVQVPPPHLTPATDSCKTLSGYFNASQCTAGQYSLHFSQKIWSILGEESVCYAGGETGAALPALRAATFHTQAMLPQQGWLGRGLSLLLPKCEAGQKTFPFASRKPMDGWSQPAAWWLLYFSRHGVSRCDK